MQSPASPAWTEAVWRRAFSHTNPTVVFMAFNTFFSRLWTPFWLAGTSAQLVHGPLLRALCNPSLLKTGELRGRLQELPSHLHQRAHVRLRQEWNFKPSGAARTLRGCSLVQGSPPAPAVQPQPAQGRCTAAQNHASGRVGAGCRPVSSMCGQSFESATGCCLASLCPELGQGACCSLLGWLSHAGQLRPLWAETSVWCLLLGDSSVQHV